MANAKTKLSIGLTFCKEEEINEVETLLKEIEGSKWTRSDIFLTGLRAIVRAMNKAKDLVK